MFALVAVLWIQQEKSKGNSGDGNEEWDDSLTAAVPWTVCCIFGNIIVCFLGWWRCFANNYLQWAAICTWLLLNIQGRNFFKNDIFQGQITCSNEWSWFREKFLGGGKFQDSLGDKNFLEAS